MAEEFRRGDLRAGRDLLRFCGRASVAPLLRETFEYRLLDYRSTPEARVVCIQGLVALHAARFLSSDDVIAIVRPRLNDPFQTVSAAAAHALASVDPLASAGRLHAAALSALRSPLGADALAAISALRATGDEERIASFVESVIAQLVDGDRFTRLRTIPIIHAVALFDGRAHRVYRSLFADSDPAIRRGALEALDEARFAGAEDLLLHALADADVFTIALAKLRAMKSVKLSARVRELLELATPDRRRYLRAALR